MELNESGECLKQKHGKGMALKVEKDYPPAVLLHKALDKWKAYFSNCYESSEDYFLLLLEGYKEAMLLPGSTKVFVLH